MSRNKSTTTNGFGTPRVSNCQTDGKVRSALQCQWLSARTRAYATLTFSVGKRPFWGKGTRGNSLAPTQDAFWGKGTRGFPCTDAGREDGRDASLLAIAGSAREVSAGEAAAAPAALLGRERERERERASERAREGAATRWRRWCTPASQPHASTRPTHPRNARAATGDGVSACDSELWVPSCSLKPTRRGEERCWTTATATATTRCL